MIAIEVIAQPEDLIACAKAMGAVLRLAGGDILVERGPSTDREDFAVLVALLRHHKPAVARLLAAPAAGTGPPGDPSALGPARVGGENTC